MLALTTRQLYRNTGSRPITLYKGMHLALGMSQKNIMTVVQKDPLEEDRGAPITLDNLIVGSLLTETEKDGLKKLLQEFSGIFQAPNAPP